MTNLLLDLELEELSLVDRPANAQATVSLFKRDNSEEDIEKMTDEEKIKAYMEKNSCSRAEAMKALGMKDEGMEKADKLTTENERLRKFLIDNGYTIGADKIEKKQDEDFIEFEGQKIVKSDDRYELVKRLHEVELEKQEQALAKRAEEKLPNLKSEVAVTLLKTADSLDDDKEFMEFLNSLDALFGKQFEEAGSSDAEGEMKTATEKMDELVTKYLTDNGLSKRDRAKAYAEVSKTDTGKELLKQVYKGE